MARTPTLAIVVGLSWILCAVAVRGDEPTTASPAPASPPTPPAVVLPPEPVPVTVPEVTQQESATVTEVHPAEETVCPDDAPLRAPEFFGDQAPVGSLRQLPSGQIQGQGAIFVPSARYFKISDNDSPRPQTRTYFSFNYFYDLNGVVNQALGGGIRHTRIHREIWGVEWADKDGGGSFGLRLPLATFNAAGTVPGLDGTSTDLGDLSIIFKEVFWEGRGGNLLSGGLAVVAPTATGSFAGSNNIKVFHHTSLQPFCGWIWNSRYLYLQGFTAVDAPMDLNDVVMLSNDLAAGFFLYQKKASSGLSAVVPTLEIHVNTPLNHRGVLNLSDPAGNPDMVDLTGGVHFEYRDRTRLGIGFAVPLTGPRMFEFEILAQCSCRY
jgi:hypothetical protein